RQRLDVVAAAQRVDRVRDTGLVRDDLLSAQCKSYRVLGWQSKCLVVGVGVQALSTTKRSSQALESRANDVVERLLRRERDTRGLGVETHPPRGRIAGPERLAHLAGPDAACSTVLGDLLEEIDVGVEEEREPRSEVVHVEPTIDPRLHIGEAVR